MSFRRKHCTGTMSIADDVGVFGKDKAEHDANLHNLMKTSRRHGLVFNIDKCEIKPQSLKFFGLVFDAEGAHPDPKRTRDIEQMGRPANSTELQEFLGIATYMSPFLPKLSQQIAPLRDLLKKEAEFERTPSHDAVFEDTKALICRHVTLSYLRPEVDSVVQVDASSRGLGAVLLQNGKPIAFASKTLSDCEQRYANIEREMLAVVFGCERFHTYLFGKRFLVQSDQKPLEMIHRKNLAAAPQRLQRMLLRLQPYDVELRYKPGKEMALAGTMSRQPCRDKEQIELDVQITFVQFSTKILQELRGETQADDELCALKTVITDGWPERQSSLPATLRPYWSCRDELSIEDSLIMKGDRLVIPSSMQVQILAKLHESHQGIEKTRLRARATVYWKNINRDIDEIVRKCDVCQQMQRLTDRQTSQRINHDRRGATDLARLIPGQDVRVEDTTTGVCQPASRDHTSCSLHVATC